MLKNVRLHIETDEEKQNILEEKLARHITDTHNSNVNAFQRHIPSLLPLITGISSKTLSIFCNKYGEYNIVDYGQGRTLYGLHPQQEINEQYKNFAKRSQKISLVDKNNNPKTSYEQKDLKDENTNSLVELESYKKWMSYGAFPSEVDCLVVLGCGLGTHLHYLIENHNIKHVIVYEPENQYFASSCLVSDWRALLELAKSNGTGLYMQIGKDGRDIIKDMTELRTQFPITEFYLYQHYNHPIFSSINLALTNEPWQSLESKGISFYQSENYLDYCPVWTTPVSLEEYSDVDNNDSRLNANLEAFKRYLPNIYKQFVDYSPRKWIAAQSATDEINLIKKDTLVSWYGKSPKEDCRINFEGFSDQPNKDGLELGYTGTKLAHYLHYKFVKATERLIEEEEEQSPLPENIQSIIMFGLGVGYQLEYLLESHTIENIFVCEPNPDFFYASLYTIDWQYLLEKLDQSKARLYLNVGDGGTSLFRDLLNQFYSIGPYILSNTYFYQSYYNAELNNTIAQMREQLRIVIVMGEYFDHAYYGISHTKEILSRSVPVLCNEPASKLSIQDKEVPILLIGNGPSLDHSIETIKELQDQAILITCGTSLQVMQRNGITPDFHAEIEQNRTTHDWAVLIDDLEYLKNINLISCNGIHPDTCELYKNVYIAFKEGESSTVSALNVIGESSVEKLHYSFPTVANFACNLFSVMGFESIYLVGIDLGFIDDKHHHSVQSSYYKDNGDECYNYADKNNTSLVVPGNFRATVNTKHEFKMSKQIIEQLLGKVSKTSTFYNCSDGAKIVGAASLKLENVLVVNTKEDKLKALDSIKNKAYFIPDGNSFIERFNQQYYTNTLNGELDVLEKLIGQDVSTYDDADKLIRKQKELLFHSYKNGNSLLFYFLYGTINYANAVLSKLSHFSGENQPASYGLLEGIRLWKNSFSEIKKLICAEDTEYDVSCRYISERESLLDRTYVARKKILIVTNSVSTKGSMEFALHNTLRKETNIKIADYQEVFELDDKHFDLVVYHRDKQSTCCDKTIDVFESFDFPIYGSKNTTAIIYNSESEKVRQRSPDLPHVIFLSALIDSSDFEKRSMTYVSNLACYYAITAGVHEHNCDLMLFKYQLGEDYCEEEFEKLTSYSLRERDTALDFGWYILVYFDSDKSVNRLLKNGTRGKYIRSQLTPENRINAVYDQEMITKIRDYQEETVPVLVDGS